LHSLHIRYIAIPVPDSLVAFDMMKSIDMIFRHSLRLIEGNPEIQVIFNRSGTAEHHMQMLEILELPK
jgi:hypothetical protein